MLEKQAFFIMNKTDETCFVFKDRKVTSDETEEIFITNIVTGILKFLC